MAKTLEDYLSRSYPIELILDEEEGGYFVQHPDLDGCAAQGETVEEAIENLEVARELWIEAQWEDGLPIPEPPPFELSGRVSLRMAPSLHAQLAKIASRQEVSLNLLLNTILAERSGYVLAEDRALDAINGLKSPAQGGNPFTSWDDSPVILRSACELFRKGEKVLARELLGVLPEPKKSNFLVGLLFLSEGSSESLRYCAAAYEAGLTDIEATTVYECAPGLLKPEDLKSRMIFICTSANVGEFADTEIQLAAWLENAKENHRRAREWKKDISEEFTEWLGGMSKENLGEAVT